MPQTHPPSHWDKLLQSSSPPGFIKQLHLINQALPKDQVSHKSGGVG